MYWSIKIVTAKQKSPIATLLGLKNIMRLKNDTLIGKIDGGLNMMVE